MTAPAHAWTFPARVERVIDGDTLQVACDVGFELVWRGRIRLLGVNTPELHGPAATAGAAARDATIRWTQDAAGAAADPDWPILIETHGTDHFGRYLGVVWRRDLPEARSLNEELVASGHAAPYPP